MSDKKFIVVDDDVLTVSNHLGYDNIVQLAIDESADGIHSYIHIDKSQIPAIVAEMLAIYRED